MIIGLVYDLRSEYLAEGYTEEQVAEFDAEETAAELAGAIRSCGHSVDRIGRGRALAARLAEGERWDLVFNIAEGLNGRSREAQVPALLELYGIPYTFSDPMVCAMTLDKSVAKRIVMSYGLETPAFTVVAGPDDLHAIDLEYPLFVKPVAEGTGRGIDRRSRVDNSTALHEASLALLERCQQPVLVEEYLPGREFTTGILGSESDARSIGTMEIRVLPEAPATDYSFLVKEQCESCVEYETLASGSLRAAVEGLALEAYRALECRDAGRVDIRLNRKQQPSFIELNPLPGLHPTHSDLPMIASQQGMPYADLIDRIINSAARRAYPRERSKSGTHDDE